MLDLCKQVTILQIRECKNLQQAVINIRCIEFHVEICVQNVIQHAVAALVLYPRRSTKNALDSRRVCRNNQQHRNDHTQETKFVALRGQEIRPRISLRIVLVVGLHRERIVDRSLLRHLDLVQSILDAAF